MSLLDKIGEKIIITTVGGVLVSGLLYAVVSAYKSEQKILYLENEIEKVTLKTTTDITDMRKKVARLIIMSEGFEPDDIIDFISNNESVNSGGLGLDYSLSKRNKVYGDYTINNDDVLERYCNGENNETGCFPIFDMGIIYQF